MTGVVGGSTVSLTVAQNPQSNSGDPLAGGALIYPAPSGYSVNPNPATLADIPQIWGRRRDRWVKGSSLDFASASSYSSWYQPVNILHQAATQSLYSPAGMHFMHTGQAIEVLFDGTDPWVTLIADGRYCSSGWISTALTQGTTGPALNSYSCFTKFDFGSIATRRISLYCASSGIGACAVAIGPNDAIVPWDRSYEPSMCVMADSYGQGASTNWFLGGPFSVAASLLGIPHIDINAMGGTGYAPVYSPYAFTSNPGNTFVARVSDSVVAVPDLFMTGGSINDDYGIAIPPLYNTVADANAAFELAVNTYYVALRTALPNSVLAAMGPWAPKQSIPTSPIAQGKLDIITQALKSVSGPWVLIDNLNGGWINSSGASGPQTGPWQTGTGTVAAPTGQGNGDIYVSADGTHPTTVGHDYLGQMLASNLAAGILAL